MNTNLSVWHYYQNGFIHPDYAPYIRDRIQDENGNIIEINRTKRQGSRDTVEPYLVRRDKGMKFMRIFNDDPCPVGWKKAPDSMCVADKRNQEPVFFTEKAFIAKNQYWNGYATDEQRNVSEPTDLRSVNPLTGLYTVYYAPHKSNDRRRYVNPVRPDRNIPLDIQTKIQYDQSWGLPVQSSYKTLGSKDSFIA